MSVLKESSNEDSQLSSIWLSTSTGNVQENYVRAHKEDVKYIPYDGPLTQITSTNPIFSIESKMEAERALFSESAAFSTAQGKRNRLEVQNEYETRLCYERDRDRITHSDEFRRLADKTQVFLNASDHQRTRATHSFEVAQIANAIATSLRLNATLVTAIALGHDCGHGPGGHAAEDAFSKYLPQGFNHALFGADLMGKKHNLCDLTLDGIRNHSWSLQTPLSCEGEIVAWADRIAYVCHDYEDALRQGLLTAPDLPSNNDLKAFLQLDRKKQISLFINDLVNSTIEKETISMSLSMGEMLCEFRKYNHEKIYNTEESKKQNLYIVNMLDSLVSHYLENFNLIPIKLVKEDQEFNESKMKIIITYLAGMTDNYAIEQFNKIR
jgi:dGTPase